ncbi:MAG: DUF5615 family PIN-like protein [Bacteroidia bacterium]|nr:DUF5615 family PIN-like protein [Bacteroidia bacterium]
MVIIADENIPLLMQEKLKSNGFDVVSIYSNHRGLNDFEIIQLAQQYSKAIILTEDKDFGEWVFAHHIKNISVVFLRYHFTEVSVIIEKVVQLFLKNHEELLNSYTTITSNKIRTRNLF